MATKKLRIPTFRNEKEEAAWLDGHRSEVEADLREAMRGKRTLRSPRP